MDETKGTEDNQKTPKKVPSENTPGTKKKGDKNGGNPNKSEPSSSSDQKPKSEKAPSSRKSDGKPAEAARKASNGDKSGSMNKAAKNEKTPKSTSKTPKNNNNGGGSTKNTPRSGPRFAQNTPGSNKNTPRNTSRPNNKNFLKKQNSSGAQNSQQFEAYMPAQAILAKGLATKSLGPGSLLQGVLRINQKSYEDAFVCSPDGTADIYIKGIRDRNRALNGDIVIVEVEPAHKWNILHDNIQDYLEVGGKEEDYRILHKNATFNLKQEAEDSQTAADVVMSTEGGSAVSPEVECRGSVPEGERKVSEEPVYGSKLTEVKVSDTPWDVSGVDVDHLANDILKNVQMNKEPREKKDRSKQPITIVAPDELESLDEGDSDEQVDSDVSDVEDIIEQNLVRMSALGLNPADQLIPTLSNTAVIASESDVPQAQEEKAAQDVEKGEGEDLNCDEDSGDDVIIESEVVVSTPRANKTQDVEAKKKRKKNGNKSNFANDSVIQLNTSTPSKSRSTKPKKLPTVEFQLEDVVQHPLADSFLQRTGRVVNIVEFKHNRCAVGVLKPYADRNPRCALFSPSDSRIPRLSIPMDQCPDNFLNRHQDFINTIFLARIETWDYPGKATGSIMKVLGDADSINARTEALLYDLNIDFAEFTDEVLQDLPSNHAEWTVPEEEIKMRRDFRKECVFTIDPLTARDLDDALSVRLDSEGKYHVGVHIADVSYFVREGSQLDTAASQRTTSTYLAQRVIPMLPRPLCENLCSLNPGVDRLTYTVEWVMDQEGKILSEWFGRSVIRSCVKLAYEHAQMMIDEPEKKSWEEGSIPEIQSPYSQEMISEKVNMLQKLALALRGKRESQGYLKITQPKLSFTLDPETGMPYGFKVYEHKHSNKLIEEFMLLANMAVARKIYTVFPHVAVLRRHPPPKVTVMKSVLEALKAQGIHIKFASAPELHDALKRFEDEKPELVKVIQANLLKCMELAKYFCTGMLDPSQYSHYALNVPFYTHFTSPIRRYPDILVHRLLDYAVRGRSPSWDPMMTHSLCDHSNDKRLAAKTASEMSALLFLGVFVAQSGSISQEGSVTKVLDHALDVYLADLGIHRRVYTDKMDIKSFKKRRILAVSYMDIEWKNGRRQTLTTFSPVKLTLTKSEKPFEFITSIDPPANDVDDVITLD